MINEQVRDPFGKPWDKEMRRSIIDMALDHLQ